MLVKQQRLSEARNILNDILQSNPDSFIAITRLAFIDLLEGKEQNAWQLTAKALYLAFKNLVPRIPIEQSRYSIMDLLDLLDGGIDHWIIRLHIALTYLQYNVESVQFREFLKTVSPPSKELKKYFDDVLRDVNRVEYQPMSIDEIPCEEINHHVDSKWVIITASSTSFFPQLLNFIGSLHYHCLHLVNKIIVYDIGLTNYEINYVEQLSKVKVKTVPPFYTHAFSWCTWKLWVLKDCAENENCDAFLYCDCGLQIQNDLSPIFDLIYHHGHAFFHYGNDFLNRDWTTEAVYRKLGLQKSMDFSSQILAGIQGYASEGIAKEKVLDTAFQLAADERMLRPSADCIENRHDQSLLSLLIQIHKIQTFYWKPIIQPWSASEQEQKKEETIFYLCRHFGIGGHDRYLVQKGSVKM